MRISDWSSDVCSSDLRDVRRGDGQVAEIGDRDRLPRDTRVDDGQFHMIAFEQLTQQPEFVEELERRGMDRVAPEIEEEIGVLFEHDRLDPGAREKQPRHPPRRPAADRKYVGAGTSVSVRVDLGGAGSLTTKTI